MIRIVHSAKDYVHETVRMDFEILLEGIFLQWILFFP